MRHARLSDTDRESALFDLRIQNHRFDVVLNNLNQGVCFFDGSGRLVLANRRYAEIYGLDFDSIRLGMTLEEVVILRAAVNAAPTMAPEDYLAWRNGLADSGDPTDTTVELSDGRVIAIHHQPMSDGGGVATHEDITDRLRIEQQIAYLARHDVLTGLANRPSLREHLARLSESGGRGSSVAVLCLDLDHFKRINDEFGYEAGNALLCATARRLRGCIRQNDLLARLGSDEFVIVQAGTGQPARATAMADRLVEAFRQPFQVAGQPVTLGISVGIAIDRTHEADPETLLTNAEIALSDAKAAGRDSYRCFEPAMYIRARARREMEKDLRSALETGQFELFYQPKLNTQTETLTGLEALIRWHHPERGVVSPGEFIPLAEELGLIVPIGEQMLRQACRHATAWPDDVPVAVNLSPVQFQAASILAVVRDALTESGLRPSRLELEITENVLIRDTDATLATLRELRDLGVRVALDDFGTGYSSIAYLSRFPLDRLKIDQSFLRDLTTSPHALAIVRTIITLGHSLGIAITAEGVETADQLAILRAERCLEVQGFLFSHPVPVAAVPALIARFRRPVGIAA